MQYEFATKDDKKPDPSDVPTHVKLGDTEYKVTPEGVLDAPARYQNDLVNHGFRVRQRDKIRVDSAQGGAVGGKTDARPARP